MHVKIWAERTACPTSHPTMHQEQPKTNLSKSGIIQEIFGIHRALSYTREKQH